jgi:hypothetical protein
MLNDNETLSLQLLALVPLSRTHRCREIVVTFTAATALLHQSLPHARQDAPQSVTRHSEVGRKESWLRIITSESLQFQHPGNTTFPYVPTSRMVAWVSMHI